MLTPYTFTGTLTGVDADNATLYDTARAEAGPAGGVAITAITNADPCVVTTATALGLPNGSPVTLSGIVGPTALNGVTTIRNVSGATFELDIDTSDTTDYPAYSGSGVATPLAEMRRKVQAHIGRLPVAYYDANKTGQLVSRIMSEDKDLDAITVATCNHWHSLLTIWACQAGKVVYVEKPCSHNVFEGRQCVEAARKYKRMVQHGTQQRSGGAWQTARDIAAGKFGRLLVARGRSYRVRNSIGFKPPKDPPAEFDYNLWLGPAPQQPYHENLVHYYWHWFWDTGNGDIGNNGVHAMDATRWLIPNATLPQAVFSLGGRFLWNDQAQTPNLQFAVFDFGPTKMIFEVTEFKTAGGREDRVFDGKAQFAINPR